MSFSQRFLVIAVICSLCFPLGTQARGIGDFIEKTILETGLGISAHKDSAADLTFGLDADSPGLAFLDGLGIAAAYKQQISPGSESSYFKRADRWKLKFTICPGDLIADALDLPFSLRVSKGRNITFVRFFANEQEAKSAKSYDLKHLPLTAERAVKMLKPGDFVSMPARLNVIGKVQLSKKLALFKGKIGSHYMASGEFHINVLRMKNKLVRLRIGSVRKKQAGLLTGKLVFGVDLFGLQFGNEKLQSVLNLNLASYKLLRESGELLFFDYVFDLKDVKAREAYDAIVATSKHLKPVSALASILEKRPLHDRYISDITKAEALFQADKEKPESERRVDRLFKGHNEYAQHSNKLKLGKFLFSFGNGSTYTECNLTHWDRNDVEKRYFFAESSATRKFDFFFKWRSMKWTRSMSSLFTCDENGKPNEFKTLNVSYLRKDTKLSKGEQGVIKHLIDTHIPKKLLANVNWQQWNFKDKRWDTKFAFRVIFHSKTVEVIGQFDKSALEEKLREYIKNHDNGDDWRYLNRYELEAMVDTIHRATRSHRKRQTKEIIKDMVELRKNLAFRELGVGYIISMLPEKEWSSCFNLELQLKASDAETVSLAFGNDNEDDLYEDMFLIQGLFDEAAFEMHKEAELETVQKHGVVARGVQRRSKRQSKFDELTNRP